MKWKQPVILFSFLVLLGAWFYYFDIYTAQKNKHEFHESSRMLPGLTIDSLAGFSVERIPVVPDDIDLKDATYRVRIVRDNGNWTLVEPVTDNCDQPFVESVVHRFLQVSRKQTTIENPESLVPFGLNNPAFILTLDFSNTHIVVKIGDMNPSGDAFYSIFNGDDTVYLLSNDIYNDLILTSRDFRDRRILEGGREDVTELSIEFLGENTHLTFDRDENHEWFVSNGRRFFADQTRVQQMVGGLVNQRIQNFIDEPVLFETFGLDSPYLTIHAKSGMELFVLDIGNYADEGGKMRYALRNRKTPVLILGRDFFEVFRPDFFYYRSKHICRMDRGVINTIEIESPSQLIRLQRVDSSGWIMLSPPAETTDSTAVGSFLSTLTHLRATGLKPETLPFGDTVASIRLFTDAPPHLPLTTLVLGGYPPDGVGRWIKNTEEDTVFRISESDIELIFPDSAMFMLTH